MFDIFYFTSRMFGLHLIIVDLERGIGPGASEPHHVVFPIIQLDIHLANGNVLCAQVVSDKDIPRDLKIVEYRVYSTSAEQRITYAYKLQCGIV